MNRVAVLLIGIATLSTPVAHAQLLAKWVQRLNSTGLSVGINPLNPNSVYAQNSVGNFLVSYDRGKTWTPHGSLPVQQAREILVNPLDTTVTLCAAFTGGLHRSSDNGLTWTTVIAGFGIDGESVALNPVHPDTVYAGDFSTTHVYLSTDRGATWTLRGTIGGSICAFSVRPDSTNILYAGAGSGRIAKSTDYGTTWRIVKPAGSEEIPKIVVSRLYPMTALGSAYEGPDSTEGVWKTTDGGEHWSLTSLQARSIWSLDIDPANPSIAYAGTFSENAATVFVTSDGGTSWASVNAGIAASSDSWNIKVHPLDGSAVWLAEDGTHAGIYQYVATRTIVRGFVLDSSTGDTVRNGWIVNTSTHDTVDLEASNGTYVFGYFPGDSSMTAELRVEAYPFYTTDVPVTFVRDSVEVRTILLPRLATAGITVTLRDSLTLQPVSARITLFFSTTEGSGSLTDSTDQNGVLTFAGQYVSQPPAMQYNGIEINPDVPYPHSVLSAFTLTGSGVTFSLLLPKADVFLVCADSNRFMSYYEAALDSLGVTWNFWHQPGLAPLGRVSSFRKNVVIYYTGNRSVPFTQEENDSLRACLSAAGSLLLTGQNIAEDNDTTTLLRDIIGVSFGGNVNALSSVTGVPNDLFASLSFGTFGTGGANNQTSKDRLTVTGPHARACLDYNVPSGVAAVRREGGPGKAILMGFGFEGINTVSARRSVMQRVIGYFDGSISAGVVGNTAGKPVEFFLGQNYPNPFNPSTTIMYSIPHETRVTLDVYSMIGRKVMTLLENEREQAGPHEVTFVPSTLASGVYFYRIRAGAYVETRKLILLK